MEHQVENQLLVEIPVWVRRMAWEWIDEMIREMRWVLERQQIPDQWVFRHQQVPDPWMVPDHRLRQRELLFQAEAIRRQICRKHNSKNSNHGDGGFEVWQTAWKQPVLERVTDSGYPKSQQV